MSQVRTDRLDASWAETLDRVRAFVAARVGDPELAADITNDVVVRSIASGALDRVDNPAAWLYRSARNAVIDHYRTRHVHDPLDDADAWPDPGPTDNQPNEATRELARCLQPCCTSSRRQRGMRSPGSTSTARRTSRPPISSASPCPG